MKTKTLLAVAVLAATSALSVGTMVQAETSGVLRQISVSGESRILVAPDLATITLGVTEEDAEAQVAMAEVSGKVQDMISALKAAGIAPEDLQTQQISMSPIWDRDRYGSDGENKITGFRASNTLSVTVRDLDRLGQMLDVALQVGANEFRGLSFGVEDGAAILDQIRGDAVTDAIRKAGQLAEAAGMDLGRVRSISDHAVDRGGPGPMMAMEMARSAPVPIEAGQISFSYSVSVVLDLEPAPKE